MAVIEEEYVKNWNELHKLIDEYFTHFNNYIFRGQSSDDWKLKPTLSRLFNDSNYASSEKKTAIDDHLLRFKENIRGRTDLDLDSTSDDQFWALGQHHGLATPLLDWTRSPYVALFFALNMEINQESENGALYAIFEKDISKINTNKRENQRGVHIVNPLTHHNNRLVNQRGLFLHIPVHINFEQWLKSGIDFDWVSMYKITFPRSISKDALSALNNMNINNLSLFPDLHGSSLHSNYQFLTEPYLASKRMENN